jgi:carbamoyl-phosphate synthase large subunit
VHSGDATLVLPAQKLYVQTVRKVKAIAQQIAKALNISGE